MDKRTLFSIGQAVGFALRAMKSHATVVSGAYKSRQVKRGIDPESSLARQLRHVAHIEGMEMILCADCRTVISDTETTTCKCGVEWEEGSPRWRPLTEDELLKDALGVMDNHITHFDECVEHFLETKEG